MVLCNEVMPDKEQGARGDPTEVALYQATHRAGYERQSLGKKLPRIGDIPFDSERKRMTTVHRVSEREGDCLYQRSAGENFASMFPDANGG